MIKEWSKEQWEKHWELARRNKLSHLLHPKQREVVNFIKNNPNTQDIAIYSARKMGKSMMLAIYGFEYCMQNPGSIVRHVLPSLKNSKDVVVPIVGELLPFIPIDQQPIYYASTGTYLFKNGSTYILNGCHKDSLDSARGPRCDLYLFDECAFYDPGSYSFAMDSVFLPQQTLVPNPKRLYATTPPVTPDHPFILTTLPLIQAKGAFFHYTVYDSPLISKERIEEIKERLGETSNAWRREYLAELVADDTSRVTPEFNPEVHVTEELPATEDVFGKRVNYVGLQIADYGVGAEDFTGIINCIFDHNSQQLIVIGEQLEYKPTIEKFVTAWNENQQRYLSTCYEIKSTIDAFESLRYSLRVQYGLDFLNPKKGKITDNVAFLRNCFENNKVLIHSSCKNLIKQCKDGIWKENHKEFERTESLGHLDLLVCLIYGVRSVDWNYRPGNKRNNIQLGINIKKVKQDAAKKASFNLR